MKRLFTLVLILASGFLHVAATFRGTTPSTTTPLGAGFNFATHSYLLNSAPSSALALGPVLSFSFVLKTSALGSVSFVNYINMGDFATFGISVSDFPTFESFSVYPTGTNTCSNPGHFCFNRSVVNSNSNVLVSGTANGSTICFYANAILQGACLSQGTFTSIPSGTTLTVGGFQRDFAMTMTDLCIWSRAVSQAEYLTITNLMQAGQAGCGSVSTSGLVGHWPMNESHAATSGTVTDTSGSGNNLTWNDVPPVVAVTAPSNGATVSGNVSITATCTSATAAISAVSFYHDTSVLISTDTSSPFAASWNSTGVTDGSHNIRALCADVFGNLSHDDITVTTNNGTAAQALYFAPVSASPPGNDANPCSITLPCLTIAHLNTFVLQADANVYFKGGGTWSDKCQYWNQSNTVGPSVAHPITFQSYGTGVGGLQNPGSSTSNADNCGTASGISMSPYGTLTFESISGIVVTNLNFTGSGLQSSPNSYATSRAGLMFLNFSAGQTGDAIVSNLDMSGTMWHGCPTPNSSNQCDYGGDIFTEGTGGGGLANLTFTNLTMHGNNGIGSYTMPTSMGGFAASNDGAFIYSGILTYHYGGMLLSEGAFGLTGPGPGCNGNAGTGGACNVQFSITHSSGYNMNACGGPVGFGVNNSINIVWKFLEAYGIAPSSYTGGCDWVGYDYDFGSSVGIAEYLYAHNNFGGAFIHFMNGVGTWNDNTYRYSVSENDDASGATGSPILTVFPANGFNTLYFYNITAWNNLTFNGSQFGNVGIVSTCIGATTATNFTGFIGNNICAISGSPSTTPSQTPPEFLNFRNVTPSVVIDYNWYFTLNPATFGTTIVAWWGATQYSTFASYKAGSGQDAHSTFGTTPGFSGTPPVGNCSWTPSLSNGPQPCPAAYNLNAAAGPIGIGVDLTQAPYSLNVGTRDYYGTSIPNGVGTGYNIGADGAHH